MPLGDSLSDERDRLDRGELEALERTGVDGPRRRKVDDDISVGALLDRVRHRSVNGEERLLGTPVELLNVVSSERVDHRSDRGRLASARKVEVEHALDRARLKTVDEGPRRSVERTVPRTLGLALGRLERDDAVLSRLATGGSGGDGSGGEGNVATDGGGGSDGGEVAEDGGGGGEGGSGLGDAEGEGDDVGDVRLGAEAGEGVERISSCCERRGRKGERTLGFRRRESHRGGAWP